MVKPKILALSDGRAGIERQAQALANAIALEFANANIETIRLNPKGLQILLPPKLWPMPINALPTEQQNIFKALSADILVANGRRSIAYSLSIKRQNPETLVVQIQDPKLNTKNFDFVIAPKHDNVKGDNVFETLGGMVFYSKEAINNSKAEFTQYSQENRQKILVILGGNSKTHKFSEKRGNEILAQLKSLQSQNRVFWISASRRTPKIIIDKFRDFANKNNHVFFENEKIDGKNPYLAWLACADIALITEDSANMLADAAFFELPIYLLRLEGHSKKFDRLHNSFINAKSAKWFTDKLEIWQYNAINNTQNIAKAIAKKWQSTQKGNN